jgi:hypothetical protein
MKRAVWIFGLIFSAMLISQPVLGEENESEYGPWKKFSISLGGFIAEMDTTVRFDSKTLGLGTVLDVE